MAVKLEAVFVGTKQAIRAMKKTSGGSVINRSLIEGIVTDSNLAAYNGSKGGVRIFTKSAVLHCARSGYKIRVNALCPGNIETDMQDAFRAEGIEGTVRKRIPQRRCGKPDDLDGATLLLASDAGRYITGVALPVDGGQTLSWM